MALIRREDLTEQLHKIPGYLDDERETLVPLREIKKLISLMPEADAAPVVRCKECRHGESAGTEWICDKHSGHINILGEDRHYKEWHDGNWFCADGERRD